MSAMVESNTDALAYTSYLATLCPPEEVASNEFVHYYSFPESVEKVINQISYSRKEFSILVQRAISMCLEKNLYGGKRILMHLTGNHLEDLILRSAATVLGFVPVTVNWQADSLEQVKYKLLATNSSAVIYDDHSMGIEELKTAFPDIAFIQHNELYSYASINNFHEWITACPYLPTQSDTRCVIFTSGTTGNPKGVKLSYSNYTTNKNTFESFLLLSEDEYASVTFTPVVVNPMHHTNSTSMTDWSLRRPNTVLHLIEKYTSQYWGIITAIVAQIPVTAVSTFHAPPAIPAACNTLNSHNPAATRRLIVPLVSRHIDFLEHLILTKSMPMIGAEIHRIQWALAQCVLLLGSAPVGPTTIQRIQAYTYATLPIVRFGSTETTLQVCGIPLADDPDTVLTAFRAGWEHTNAAGEAMIGYYIGQAHPPFTEVKVVHSVDVQETEKYLVECEDGQPGYLVTRGGHVMQGYVSSSTATTAAAAATSTAVSADGWYCNLGDIGFALTPTTTTNVASSTVAPSDSSSNSRKKNLYWMSRDSQMLIRGGANYAYEQVQSELQAFITHTYALPSHTFKIAICGMKVHSEHEDECCVVFESLTDEAREKEEEVGATFLQRAKQGGAVSKGAKPTYFRIGSIPMVQSKGIVSIPVLSKEWKEILFPSKSF